jgi:hypothetical protein
VAPPYLWPNPSPETQTQIARILAGLEDRLIKALNFFKRSEQALLRALQRPQFNIRGLRPADLTAFARVEPGRSLGGRDLGLIKRVAGAYLYYLIRLGRAAITAACSITEMRIIPILASAR